MDIEKLYGEQGGKQEETGIGGQEWKKQWQEKPIEREIEIDFGGERYDDDGGPKNSSLRGYKVIIALLVVILAAVSGLFIYQSSERRKEFDAERDQLTDRMMAVRNDFANLQTTNDSLNYGLSRERDRADSIVRALGRERNITLSTLRRYESELGTMRTIMTGYITTIDSLGRLNRALIDENVDMKRRIEDERLRAEMAEERATDMNIKLRQGSRVIARDIRLVPLSENDKEVTRASRAERLRVDFTLSANDLANPGARTIYTRIVGPDGYVMANTAGRTFNFEGDQTVYSAAREGVDYQNADLPVSIYYRGGGITAGTYTAEVYMDGLQIGSREMVLR